MKRALSVSLPSSQRTLGSTLLSLSRWDATGARAKWVPAFAGTTVRALAVAVALASTSFAVFAQDVLIRNATVHTAGAQGTLKNADVLVRNGVVQSVGSDLAAPGATVVEANGRPLTPAFFGGAVATIEAALRRLDTVIR